MAGAPHLIGVGRLHAGLRSVAATTIADGMPRSVGESMTISAAHPSGSEGRPWIFNRVHPVFDEIRRFMPISDGVEVVDDAGVLDVGDKERLSRNVDARQLPHVAREARQVCPWDRVVSARNTHAPILPAKFLGSFASSIRGTGFLSDSPGARGGAMDQR